MKYLIVLSMAAVASAAAHAVTFRGTIPAAPLHWDEATRLSQATKTEYETGCPEKRTRVEWSSMTEPDRLSFIYAIKCLMDAPPKGVTNVTSRYDELVALHCSMSDIVHQFGVFLAWHRYFVHGFETLLRDECSYTAPLPWWYEVPDAGRFNESSIFTPEHFGSLPVSYTAVDEPPESFCVTDGIFANRTVSVGVIEPGCLSRGEDQGASADATIEQLDACQKNVTAIKEHQECVENGIHISSHAAIGKTMSDVPASVNDPVFFLHHGFIDWEWMRWQRIEESRYQDVSGCIYYNLTNDECTNVSLDTVLSSNGLFPNMTIREVGNPTKGPLCYEYDFY